MVVGVHRDKPVVTGR